VVSCRAFVQLFGDLIRNVFYGKIDRHDFLLDSFGSNMDLIWMHVKDPLARNVGAPRKHRGWG
jgi:hypothetical protein